MPGTAALAAWPIPSIRWRRSRRRRTTSRRSTAAFRQSRPCRGGLQCRRKTRQRLARRAAVVLPWETQDYVLAITGRTAGGMVPPGSQSDRRRRPGLAEADGRVPAKSPRCCRTWRAGSRARSSAMPKAPWAPWGVQVAGNFSLQPGDGELRRRAAALPGDPRPGGADGRARRGAAAARRRFSRIRRPRPEPRRRRFPLSKIARARAAPAWSSRTERDESGALLAQQRLNLNFGEERIAEPDGQPRLPRPTPGR